jgi:prophage regulatory protein
METRGSPSSLLAELPRPAVHVNLLRRPAVQEVTGLTRSSLYRLIQAGEFPAPIKISASASAWVEAEVQTWISHRIARRDRQEVGRSHERARR